MLALGRSGVMQLGHVAVVSKVLNSRELLISHANWSGPGVVEQNVEAIDVSPDNDWSQVRVWYGPSGQMGSRVNPGLGFIYPKKSKLPGDHGPRFAKAQPAAPADPAPRKVPKLKVDRDIFLTEYAEVKKPSKKVRRTLDDAMADFMRGASTR